MNLPLPTQGILKIQSMILYFWGGIVVKYGIKPVTINNPSIEYNSISILLIAAGNEFEFWTCRCSLPSIPDNVTSSIVTMTGSTCKAFIGQFSVFTPNANRIPRINGRSTVVIKMIRIVIPRTFRQFIFVIIGSNMRYKIVQILS